VLFVTNINDILSVKYDINTACTYSWFKSKSCNENALILFFMKKVALTPFIMGLE